jgi:hypothetical protein
VLACLDKDPARRPASMVELRELLRPMAEQLGPEAVKHEVPERAEMTPSPATAKGLQELARAAVAPAQGPPLPSPRKSSWGALVGIALGFFVVGAGIAALRPRARGQQKGAASGDGRPAALVAGPASVASRPDVQPAPPQPEHDLLNVESDPPGADVFADHVRRGVAPLDLTVQLPVELKLTMEGYRTIRRKITRPGPVRIKLVPERGPDLPRPPEPDEEAKPVPAPETPGAPP